jgi:hypothetical protein
MTKNTRLAAHKWMKERKFAMEVSIDLDYFTTILSRKFLCRVPCIPMSVGLDGKHTTLWQACLLTTAFLASNAWMFMKDWELPNEPTFTSVILCACLPFIFVDLEYSLWRRTVLHRTVQGRVKEVRDGGEDVRTFPFWPEKRPINRLFLLLILPS